MAKRIMCIIISVLMIVSLLPTGVFADSGDDTDGIVEVATMTDADSVETTDEGDASSNNAEEGGETGEAEAEENAEEGTEEVILLGTEANATVATIGENSYETLAAAFEAATDGQTITVTGTVDESSTAITITGKSVTIDLNGQSVSVYSITAGAGATLTIKDSTASVSVDSSYNVTYSGGALATQGGNYVAATNGGTVTLASGKVTGKYGLRAWGDITGNTSIASTVKVNGGYIYAQECAVTVQGNGAKAEITNGVMETADNAVVAGNGTNNGTTNYGGTSITISGGTLIGHIQTSGYVACGIYHPQNGSLTITGGTIYADGGCGILMRGGKLTMTGGTIIATGDSTTTGKVGDSRVVVSDSGIVYDYDSGYYDVSNVSVSLSGSVSVTAAASAISVVDEHSAASSTAVTVSGGTYLTTSNGTAVADTSVNAYVADGMTVDESGAVVTDTTTYVAQIGETKYATLQAAIDAASSDDTVKLLTSVTENITIGKGDTVTLDLNGYTLTGDGGYAISVKGGTFTLKDSSGEGTGKVTRSDSTGYVIYVNGSSTNGKATFNLESGTITGGTTGGIYATAGTTSYKAIVNINGGSITNCGTNGVYGAKYATITMTGGTISYNQRGVFLSSISYPSTFTMSGGTISNNGSTTYNGGGVYVASGNKFVMTGGVITGNQAAVGGGVYAETKSNSYYFQFSGGAIYGNTATDNGNDIYATNVNAYTNATILNASSMTGLPEGTSYNHWRNASTGVLISDTTTLSGTVYLTAVTGSETYDTYTITYNANGAEGTAPTDDTPYTAKMIATTATADSLSKDGYYFTGWNTAADGSGTSYNAGGSITITGDVTLYAQWAETVAILYDSDNNAVGYYSSLADAVNAVSDSSTYTIVLQKDYSTDGHINISGTSTRNVTIDLNGHTYTSTDSSYAISLSNYSYTLTITDSQGCGKIETTTSGALAIQVPRGTLNVTGNVTISGAYTGIQMGGYSQAYSASNICVVNLSESATVSGGSYGIVILGTTKSTTNTFGPVLNISGGKVTGGTGISGNGSSSYYGSTTINISGGEVIGTSADGIYHPQVGTLNITGGLVSGATAIEMRSGTLNVEGGTITGTAEDFYTIANGSGSTVSGAGIAVSQHSTDNEINVSITGGTILGYYGIFEVNYNNNEDSEVSVTVSGEDTKVTATGTGASAIYSVSVSGGSESASTNSITTIAVSGGSFSSVVPDAYCAEGYLPTVQLEDGTYSVYQGIYLGISTDETTKVPATIASGEGTATMYVKVSADYIGTYGYYSTSAYPTTALTYTKTSDVDSGTYIFAGWYSSEDGTTFTAMTEFLENTDAYAKFVDANVLRTGVQITSGTTAETSSTNMRFISTVDSTDYSTVGFVITVSGYKPITAKSTTVYSSITATTEGDSVSYSPSDYFSSISSYFITYSLYSIPTSAFGTNITVQAYWITQDGTTVYGAERTVTVTEVIDANSAS